MARCEVMWTDVRGRLVGRCPDDATDVVRVQLSASSNVKRMHVCRVHGFELDMHGLAVLQEVVRNDVS